MEPLGYADIQTPNWTLRLRSFLADFCNIFSVVGTYIAPTYQHDRCERSVQMRLYTLSKRQFVLIFIIFSFGFTVTVFIGLSGPAVTSIVEHNGTTLVQSLTDLKTGPFVLKTPPVSSFSQQLWLTAKFFTDYDQKGKFEQPFQLGITIRGLQEDNKSSLVYSNAMHNRTRILKCSKECKSLMLLHIGFIDYSSYVVILHIGKLEHMAQSIREITFTFKNYNSTFTQLEIWFRFIFLVLTFIATCMFAHSLRKFSLRDWSMEQRWMSVLLPLILLYNNPIFPMTFLVNSWLPVVFDTVFQATFLCALLLFWLCLYHGVRQNKRRFFSFYLVKLIIVGGMWLATVTVSSWQKYAELQDPTYNYRVDSSYFMAFKVLFLTTAAIYILYLIYLLVRAYAELRYMPYFDLRLKFLTVLMLTVLGISGAILMLRFGVNIFEDDFAADTSVHYRNSAEFLAFYGLLNLYIYTMAYVYSPSHNAVYESHFKDNPALSMLNDSDDDVVYGSDMEEVGFNKKIRQNMESEEETFN